MEKQYRYVKLEEKDVTDDLFKQIMEVENSTGSGYEEEVMKEIFITGHKNDNFVCFDNDKIVAHITFNPKSKRRNGSIYMVNLTVLPEYRKQGIAKTLIKTATDYYISKGYALPMSTSVDRDNASAVNLYKRVGFQIKPPITEVEIEDDDEQFVMDAKLEDLCIDL